MLSWIRSSLVVVALAAAEISGVYIERGGRGVGAGEHYVLSEKITLKEYNSPMSHTPASLLEQDNPFQDTAIEMEIGYKQAFQHQNKPTESHVSSNCPDIQVALLDVLQNQVFVGTRSKLSCLALDAVWNEIVDASLFSGLHYDGKMQAKTFEELVSFNYGETSVISGWEYSNVVAIYGEHFARVTFDLRTTTECQDDEGDRKSVV